MDFIMGLFVGLAFWDVVVIGLLLAGGIFASTFTNEDDGEISIIFLVAFAVFLTGAEFALGWPVWSFVFSSPLYAFGAAGVYFLIGGLYVLWHQWPEWLEDQASSIRAARKSYDKEVEDTTGTPPWLKSYQYEKFTARKNKGMITSMIVLWFFDAIWKALHRPVRWASRKVYELFSEAFERVGNKTTERILNDE